MVLILVVMEDTLRAAKKLSSSPRGNVLILVVMEDTLRVRVVDFEDEQPSMAS